MLVAWWLAKHGLLQWLLLCIREGKMVAHLFICFFVSELWIILFFFLVYLFLTCLCIGYSLGLVLDVSRIKI